MTLSSQLQSGSVVHCIPNIGNNEPLDSFLETIKNQKELWVTVIKKQDNFLLVNLMFVDKPMEKMWLKYEIFDQLTKKGKLNCVLEQQIFKKSFLISTLEDLADCILRFWKDIF